MNFFIRNVVLIHIAALVLAFSWIHGGTRPDLLLPVIPWLAAFALEFLLVFPQAKSTETLSEARSRVWRALARDPLLYAALTLTVLLVIPLFNVAGAPVYDAALKLWHNPRPPLAWLPSCVRADEHSVMLLWFPPVLIAALAAKHGILKKGKRVLLEILCWNGAALALFGFVQQMTGATSVYWGKAVFDYFFSTFGYPNFAGAFFTLLFTLSAGLWFGRASAGMIGPDADNQPRIEEASLLHRHYLLVAVLMNFGGAFASLSRAAILLCAVVVVVLAVYMIAGSWQKCATSGRVKLCVAVGVVALLAGLAFTVFAPKGLGAEVKTITSDAVIERVTGSAYYHARVAKAILRDHPAFGVGGWGYRYHLMQYLTPEEIPRRQKVGGANVHNDSLQLLAEHGWIGYGLMLVCVGLLVAPLLWQAFRLCRDVAPPRLPERAPPKPTWLYSLPAPLIGVFVGTSATVCHSLGDLPFRAPSILIVWILAFVCVSGFFPAARRN